MPADRTPTTAAAAIFKGPFDHFDVLPPGRYTFRMGVDLASSIRERADYTARVTSAESRDTGDFYVLSAYRDRRHVRRPSLGGDTMTDQAPRTEAGRRLGKAVTFFCDEAVRKGYLSHHPRDLFVNEVSAAVLAIEAEARADCGHDDAEPTP